MKVVHFCGTLRCMLGMSKDTGLLKRGGWYYFRKRVPKDLVSVFGRQEIKQSLQTTDYKKAKRLRNRVAVDFDHQFERAREQLRNNLPSPTDRLAPYSLQEVESRIIHFVEKTTDERADEIRQFASENDENAANEWQFENAELIASYRSFANEQTLMDIATTERGLFEKNLLDNSLTPQEKARANEIVRRGLLEIERRKQALFRGRELTRPFDALFTRPGTISRTFANVCTDFFSDYERTTRAGLKQRERIKAGVELIKEFFGPELLISQVTREQCRAFRNLLAQLPSNARKHFPDQSISLKQLIASGKAKNLPTLKFDTQDSYLRVLRKLLQWSMDEGLITSNPAQSVMPTSERVAGKDTRDPFSIEDLRKIFAAPLFNGCLNDRDGYSVAGLICPH